MSVFESLEVIQRLLMHLRLRQGGLNVMSYVDSLNVFEDEPVEDMRVCIAWNPELELIQASVTGVSELGACQILELAVAYFHSYLLAPKE